MFDGLRKVDPYRLDDLDTYSNLLFVMVKLLCNVSLLLAVNFVQLSRIFSPICTHVYNWYKKYTVLVTFSHDTYFLIRFCKRYVQKHDHNL